MKLILSLLMIVLVSYIEPLIEGIIDIPIELFLPSNEFKIPASLILLDSRSPDTMLPFSSEDEPNGSQESLFPNSFSIYVVLSSFT